MSEVNRRPFASAMKSMQLAALAAGGGLLLWFGLLYPLVPRTTLGWALAIGAGAFIGLWVLAAEIGRAHV